MFSKRAGISFFLAGTMFSMLLVEIAFFIAKHEDASIWWILWFTVFFIMNLITGFSRVKRY